MAKPTKHEQEVLATLKNIEQALYAIANNQGYAAGTAGRTTYHFPLVTQTGKTGTAKA